MKKISLFLSCLLIGATTLFVGCDKKDDPTPEKEGKEEKVNKDLVLEYSITFSNSELTSSDAKQIELDINTIAAYLEVDKELLGSALTGKQKSDITCLAINNTTNTDTIRSNTEFHWGHWWNKNGDVVEKYDGVFTSSFSYNEGVGTFSIGLNYDQYEVGQTKITEALRYQDKCVKIVFTISVIDLNDKQHIVTTNNLSIDYVITSQSQQVTIDDFNAKATLAALGASSWDDITWLIEDEDGYEKAYVSFLTNEPNFNYDENGEIASYLYAMTVTFHEGQLLYQYSGKGDNPNAPITVKFYMLYNNKIVENCLTINFQDYIDPETAPEGTPTSIEKDISITLPRADWDYSAEGIDITEELRQCFKMTTFQIYNALKNKEMIMWYNEIGKGDDNKAFFIDKEGKYISGADWYLAYDSVIAQINLNYSEENCVFNINTANVTTNPEAKTITPKVIFEKDGVTATFNLTINID